MKKGKHPKIIKVLIVKKDGSSFYLLQKKDKKNFIFSNILFL